MSDKSSPPFATGESFRKKPVVISAKQWFKQGDHGAVSRLKRPDPLDCERCGKPYADHGAIRTLEDTDDSAHIVCPADWIIKGVKGEHYACKPDVFAMTYEKVEFRSLDDGSGMMIEHRTTLSEIAPRQRALEELLARVQDGELLIQGGECSIERAWHMATAQANRIDAAPASVPSAIGQSSVAVPRDLFLRLELWTRQVSQQPASRVATGIANAAVGLNDELRKTTDITALLEIK